MPVSKLSIQDFAAKVKAKYPEYKDVNDTLLTQKIVAKYPEYKDMVQLEVPPQQSQSPTAKTFSDQSLKLSDLTAQQQPQNSNVDVNALNVKHGQVAPTTEEKNVADYGQQVAKESLKTRDAAIDNTLKRIYKNSGIKVDKDSPKYKNDFQQKLNELQNGDIVQTKNTKTGEPTTTRGAGFLESTGNSLIESFKAPVQAWKMMNLKGKDLADYLDNLSREQPEIPESAPSGLSGQFGVAAGAFPKTAGLFAINEAVPYLGTALASAEAELSSTGAHTQEMYQQNLKALTDSGVPIEQAKIQAADKAKKDAPIAAAPDAIMMGVLGEMGANTKGLGDAAVTFKQALVKSGKSVGVFGALGGVSGAATKGIEKAQGYDVNMQDIIDNFGKEGFQYATLDAMFKIAPLVAKMPSSAQAAWKNYMTKVPKPIVEEMTSKMGEQGEAIKKDLNDYEEADKVVPQHYSDEKRVALSNLVQQKNALEKDNETAHSSFKDENKKQIEQVDNAIKTVTTSKNPSIGRLDVLTGESEGNPKEYEDLSKIQKDEIDIPTDYGQFEIKEIGEGENKKYKVVSSYVGKDYSENGHLETIKVEGEFSDKAKAKEAAEQALKQHYYENTLADHLKPQKSESQKAEITNPKTNAGSNEGNEPISSKESGVAEGKISEVGKGTSEENKLTPENDFETFKEHALQMAVDMKDSKYEFRLNIPELSQEQREGAVKDIRAGKESTPRAKKLLDALKSMHDKGVVSLNRGRGAHAEMVDYPIKEWISEPLTHEEINNSTKIDDETAQIIAKEGITSDNIDKFEHLFNDYIYDKEQFAKVKNHLNADFNASENKGNANAEETNAPSQPKKGVTEIKGFEAGTKIYRAGKEGRYFSTDKQYIHEGGFKRPIREFEIPENTNLLDLRDEDFNGILKLATDNEKKILKKSYTKNTPEARERGRVVDEILKRNGYDGYIMKDAGETKDYDTVVFTYDKSPDQPTNQPTENISQPINTEQNAIREQEPNEMGIRQSSEVGATMGSGDTQSESTTGTQEKNKATSEEESVDDESTSLKNAVVNAKIEKYGLKPTIQSARREFGVSWDEAMDKIENGYDPYDLVNELKKKPRPLTDTENAILLFQQAVKERELDAAATALNEASEKGYATALEENKVRRARLEDELQDIYNVGKAVGTENARGLVTRKRLLADNYSLANMKVRKRAANDGNPLTEEQQTEVNKQYDKIHATLKAYEARVKELEDQVTERDKKLAEQAINKEAQKEIKQERIKKKSEQIKKDLSDNFDELRKIARNQGLSANPIPVEMIPVIAKISKNLVRLGVTKIEAIATKIFDELSGSIKDLKIEDVMDALQAAYNDEKLSAYKERLKKNIDKTYDKLNRGDFSKRQKQTIELDAQAIKLKANYERAKEDYELGLKKDELAKRSNFEKGLDAFVRWSRAFKLSSPLTIAKLASAALIRIVITPAEEAIGGIYSKILPKSVTSKAIGEAGFNVKAEAKALTKGFTQGLNDAGNIIKLGRKGGKGKSDLDLAFGKKGTLPPEAIDFLGQLHSALKAVPKRAAFERSFEKRITNAMKHGVDVSNEMVKTQIAMQAYKDANRAIFMQDNFLSDGYRNWVNTLENSKKYPTAGKISSTALNFLIPFVKVPTNIIGETVTGITGLPVAGAKILHTVFTKGLENLSTDEADFIMRNMKKGSIGVGALLLGYFNPKTFGGYYQPFEERDQKDLKANQLKVFNQQIPSWLLHSPLFEVMQLGATVRRVKDKYEAENMKNAKKHKPLKEPFQEGLWAGLTGLGEQVPLLDQPVQLANLFDEKERQYYLGELVKNTIDPGLLQQAAKAQETGIGSLWTEQYQHHYEGTIGQHVESGLPFLRETLPTSKPKSNSNVQTLAH